MMMLDHICDCMPPKQREVLWDEEFNGYDVNLWAVHVDSDRNKKQELEAKEIERPL